MATDLTVAGTVEARHNWGRWIVDCCCCSSGLKVPPGTTEAVCWDCGEVIGPVVWPADPDGIEAILAYRPDPNTRNWEPGETLEQLLGENAAHGLIPLGWFALADAAGGTLELLGTTAGVITSGLLLETLPAGRPRPAIGA